MEKPRGISCSTLKIIAIVTMFIDHCGAAILERMMVTGGTFTWQHFETMRKADTILRYIGRVSFPIFCFLLVEGFLHTRSRLKYAGSLLVLAIISEIPFDLAFRGKLCDLGYQNVAFTLLIGLFVMCVFSFIEKQENIAIYMKYVLYIGSLLLGMGIAELMKTDYAAIGVFCIMVLYITRNNKVYQTIAGCATFLWETTAPLAFIPIWFYNGKRGLSLKYTFYLFYPVHLFVLYIFFLIFR